MGPDRQTGMPTRRQLLHSLTLLGAVAAVGPLAAGCADPSSGSPPGDSRSSGSAGLAASELARSEPEASHLPLAVAAVTSLTSDLYRRLASMPGNLVCSPYSVAIALAMTRNGARGTTAAEMDDVLHTSDAAKLASGLNALSALVESRAGQRARADGSRANVSIDVANSLWGQRETVWVEEFLDGLARNYGAAMHLVDYKSQPERARDLVNTWTSAKTHDKIPEIIPAGIIDDLTRLVLVNAIYLKAPWEQPFEPALTEVRPFTLEDGSQVGVETMSGMLDGAGYGRGDGWQAARLLYAGGELAMTVVLPDDGDLAAFEQSVDSSRLSEILSSAASVPVLQLRLPRWTFRVASTLNEQLAGLGMPTAFDERGADFSGMTAQEELYISAVLHEAFIAVDEKGTEAAAATAVVMRVESMPAVTPLDVDRPFMFVIHDVETSTPLFIGRVSDPTA